MLREASILGHIASQYESTDLKEGLPEQKSALLNNAFIRKLSLNNNLNWTLISYNASHPGFKLVL